MSWHIIREIRKTLAAQRDGVTAAGTIVEDGATGTPSVTSVSSSATANTFGSWTQVDAAVAADMWITGLTVAFVSATSAQSAVIEIGTGANPSEAAKVRHSFPLGTAANEAVGKWITYTLPIPVKVASGTRIAVRAADSVSSALAYNVGVHYYTGI